MPEVTTETGPKGLDAILSEAIDSHSAEFEDTSQPQLREEAGDAPDKEDAPATDKSRDDKGRFVSAEAKHSEPGTAEASEPPAIEAPTHFTAEQKAQFANLPPDAQRYLVDTEKAREAEYTRRSQEAAEYRRTADPLVQAISPHREYLDQIAPLTGQTPEGMIGGLVQTERLLRTGSPAQKQQAFAQIAQVYGIDLAALAGGQIPAAPQQPYQAYNPELLQVTAKLQEMERWRSQIQEQQELYISQQQIDAFAKETDEKGQPKNPRFEQVKTVMASFLQSGMADNLQEAYALAVQPYAAFDQELASRKASAENEQKAAIEKAKKAASVKSSTGAVPSGRSDPKGLDGHLSAALDKYFA